ncbi:hydroxyacid dehydrogenase [Sporanaerobium hydrogeniformans]|uniref:Hydroxyacid dehydrogenase n=1 Tax=Sporanaerobium hydrogeniformans TaxID=3072179 RepID=A0AC61D9S1_9FIRM|nr:four-carbon acid sugar kinase family protein [Sporanaerobium hydrogeniformans]PHV69426.1 hydroxyacid dehydrogenase [Sporanaerobium hydrogeniformans]
MEPKINSAILQIHPKIDDVWVNQLLTTEVTRSNKKIIVLDDDPTGVQTVHDVSVYTDWSLESLRTGFQEINKLFFILTNSRSFTVEQTTKVHIEIAQNIDKVAKECGKEYIIVSRGDSTLRGHYPLETKLLCKIVEQRGGKKVDGEILCPYFREGNRFTIDNIHYVKYDDRLIPVGQTEFAKDRTFGYNSSHLGEYIEEKTQGEYKAADVTYISLESLWNLEFDKIEAQLLAVKNFGKIVVNAIDDRDVKVFCIALYRAMEKGKSFMFRTAAAFVKALGNIDDKPLLKQEEMINNQSNKGGIIVVGSHTKKTTAQLEELKQLKDIVFMEMNSDLVLKKGGLEEEVKRIVEKSEEWINKGVTVAIATKRTLLEVDNDTKEQALIRSVQISEAVQALVGNLYVTPAFVMAKGGITSSDVGTKALKVKRATVLGQIRPGIPVWKIGQESKFPGIPYIIFPGNVGEVQTLREAVEILKGKMNN